VFHKQRLKTETTCLRGKNKKASRLWEAFLSYFEFDFQLFCGVSLLFSSQEIGQHERWPSAYQKPVEKIHLKKQGVKPNRVNHQHQQKFRFHDF
jgi:hypothetical protein